MGGFRQHIAFGALTSGVGCALILFYGLLVNPIVLIFLFLATIIASFLPDLDSDSGLPFHLIYGTFTVLCGAAALYYALFLDIGNIYYLIGIPLGAVFFVWFAVGSIFKSLTTHRGMMHSIPALCIVSLIAFICCVHLDQTEQSSKLFAVMVGAGYFSHLLLDEIYSSISFDGSSFLPKRSLGTAIKFFSHSAFLNIFTYCTLGILIYVAHSMI